MTDAGGLSPALPAPVAERLARLAPDQRAAATAPPGPVLCIAPAGSGKTTTLVARVAWLVATGIDPATITAVTFNARAAEELRGRLAPALEPFGVPAATAGGVRAGAGGVRAGAGGEPAGAVGVPQGAGPVRVRTFHALGLEILRDAGRPPTLVPRDRVLRRVLPDVDATGRRRLDDAFSRLKLDLAVTGDDVARDPEPGPVARAFVAYERALAAAGALDFDDLVAGALRALEADAVLLGRWRTRCAHLLVDEVQDVDRSQLRLALLLAAPSNRIFLVGDDDQSIYGWRLADVRRVLGLAVDLPGLRRVDLTVNYRCPAVVLGRAVRLVEHNRERFAKTIRAGPTATGRLVLAPQHPGNDGAARVLAALPADGGSRAVLARTRMELLPVVGACLAAGIPFSADGVPLPLEDPRVDQLIARAETDSRPLPIAARLAALARDGPTPGTAACREPVQVAAAHGEQGAPTPDDPEPEPAWTWGQLVAALVGWAVGIPRGRDLPMAIAAARERLAALRQADADLVLATAHATKGLEWDHVAVLGMTEGRFPSVRSLAEAADPARALEEERRLAYVAWTRARRGLVLVYDPDAPSSFLREAFDPDELAAGPARM
jgi:DNA helicase-2/ATP-dependent DNA helicase PcrA